MYSFKVRENTTKTAECMEISGDRCKLNKHKIHGKEQYIDSAALDAQNGTKEKTITLYIF